VADHAQIEQRNVPIIGEKDVSRMRIGDRIWRALSRKSEGVWALLRSRLLSFGMIVAIGFLLLVSLVVSAGLAAFGTWWGSAFGGWEVVLQAVNLAVSFAVITVLFALIYKILPRVRVTWHDVWIGAAVTASLLHLAHLARPTTADDGFVEDDPLPAVRAPQEAVSCLARLAVLAAAA